MIRVTGIYQWEDGAHFDHDYYHSEHMRITKEALSKNGLIRLESDRTISPHAPVPGEVIATTHAFFPTMQVAQAAMAIAAQALMEDVPRYTNLKPQIRLSEVSVHM